MDRMDEEEAPQQNQEHYPPEKIKPSKIPYKYRVKPATEGGFDLRNCMKDFKLDPEEGYEQDADYYFDSYAHFGIHEQMLKDKPRTLGYMNAIVENPEMFEGKIVLDIGCGTGVLSIFAARAGAKHVYGIEMAGIANHAKKIIKENGFQDKITIVRGKVEEIKLPVDQVDIIISEWMGYFLLYESMLDSVLFARDKWLKEDGVLLPDRAVLYLTAIEDAEYKKGKIEFWDSVYGISMKSIKKWALLEPIMDVIEKEQINTDACVILDIDIKTMSYKDLEFASEYKLKAKRDDKIHAYVAWFDVFFGKGKVPFRISTSPFVEGTHWKQTVFYLNDVISVKAGEEISGSIAVKKDRDNPREHNIKISYHFESDTQKVDEVQFYKIR